MRDPNDRPARDDDPGGLEPYLALAQEIRAEVARLAADDAAGVDSIVAAIERFPRDERARVARSVFDRLAPDAQWAVLEKAFGDEEIREYLRVERDARLEQLRRDDRHRALALAFRAAGEIDTRTLPRGVVLTLGLFRERDAEAAVRRGAQSTTAARRLVLRAGDPPWLRVIEDLFNPHRGYFVTSDYDEHRWRAERLESHQQVQVGSVIAGDGHEGDRLEPVLIPGARVDVCTAAGVVQGRLHLGFAMLADDDVFTG